MGRGMTSPNGLREENEKTGRSSTHHTGKGHAPMLPIYAQALLVAGIRYNVPSLAHACQDHLARIITPETCADLLFLADKYRALELRDAALEFAVANAREVTALEAWTQLVTERPNIAVDFSVRLANRR
ncbi:speckle-type POZ protein-like [Oratosquilla oratoria]|uniref:speckle-type POZ protein-like n=1 Tax=Oratosquilla oratoria TaxID=337810 RepID=UPI003F76DDE1